MQHARSPHTDAFDRHKFIPSPPPVPAIPPSFLEHDPQPQPQTPSPTIRSLPFSKPTVLKFQEFPNMNMAFYRDDIAPFPPVAQQLPPHLSHNVTSHRVFTPPPIPILNGDVITPPPSQEHTTFKEQFLTSSMSVPAKIESPRTQTQGRKGSLVMTSRDEHVITFSVPGLETDVKLVVFQGVFHAHSTVLKLYSGFFRRAFEAFDRDGGGGEGFDSGSRFKYEFVSVATEAQGEEAVGWTLERVAEKPQTPSTSPISPRIPPRDHQHTFSPVQSQADDKLPTETQQPHHHQELAFTNLLRALYQKPYTVPSLSSLSNLTTLAQQFSCLPTISTSLYPTFFSSPFLISSINHHAAETLLVAFKLRNKLLFKKALVWVVESWDGYHGCFEGEWRLICAVQRAWNGVVERILGVNGLAFGMLGGEGREELKTAVIEILRDVNGNKPMENRRFYDRLSTLVDREEGLEELREGLRGLLGCWLVLERCASGAWRDEEREGFMCAEIEDEDLPWDSNDEEW